MDTINELERRTGELEREEGVLTRRRSELRELLKLTLSQPKGQRTAPTDGIQGELEEIEKRLKAIPFERQGLSEKLEKAEKANQAQLASLEAVAGHIPRIQKLSVEMLTILEEVQKRNEEIIELSNEISEAERISGRRMARPFCSSGYRVISDVLHSLSHETMGEGRTLIRAPRGYVF